MKHHREESNQQRETSIGKETTKQNNQ